MQPSIASQPGGYVEQAQVPYQTNSGIKYLISNNRFTGTGSAGLNSPSKGTSQGMISIPAGLSDSQIKEVMSHVKTTPEYRQWGMDRNEIPGSNGGMNYGELENTPQSYIDQQFKRGSVNWDANGNPIGSATSKKNIATKMNSPATINGKLA